MVACEVQQKAFYTNIFKLSHFFLFSLEMLDKVEPPSIPEGYAMSVAFSALLDLVRGITTMIERELTMEEEAAAELRETHPNQEWRPQPGEDAHRKIKLQEVQACSDNAVECKYRSVGFCVIS